MARQADPALRRRWQALVDKQHRSGLTIAEFFLYAQSPTHTHSASGQAIEVRSAR